MNKTVPRTRFDAFSDAVFAIAMTIMVLEFKVPETEHSITNSNIIDALQPLLPVLTAYIVSFFILGQLWISHSRLTEGLDYISVKATRLNILFLFFVCLVPFPMALVSGHGFLTATLVPYGSVLLGATAALGATRLAILEETKGSQARIKLQRKRIIVSFCIALIGLGLATISPANSIMAIISYFIVGLSSLPYRILK